MTRGRTEQRVLVLVTLALVAFGLVMVFSATSASAAIVNGDPMTYLIKQAVYALAGVVLLLPLSSSDSRVLRGVALMLLVGAFVLCLAVLVLAPAVNGARRWFVVGPLSVQPSELAKLALCLWACARLSRRPPPRTLGELIKPLGIVTAVFCGVIVLEPDLGTTIAIVAMIGGILLVSGVPLRLFVLATTLSLAVGSAAIWAEPYRRARFFSFLHPTADPQGAGYQIHQAMIGVGSGQLPGVGLGNGP